MKKFSFAINNILSLLQGGEKIYLFFFVFTNRKSWFIEYFKVIPFKISEFININIVFIKNYNLFRTNFIYFFFKLSCFNDFLGIFIFNNESNFCFLAQLLNTLRERLKFQLSNRLCPNN